MRDRYAKWYSFTATLNRKTNTIQFNWIFSSAEDIKRNCVKCTHC